MLLNIIMMFIRYSMNIHGSFNAIYISFAVFEMGQWHILEPVMLVETIVPSEFQGVAIKQLSQRSGVIISMDTIDEWTVVRSEVRKQLS